MTNVEETEKELRDLALLLSTTINPHTKEATVDRMGLLIFRLKDAYGVV
jgi:hypothetical protein